MYFFKLISNSNYFSDSSSSEISDLHLHLAEQSELVVTLTRELSRLQSSHEKKDAKIQRLTSENKVIKQLQKEIEDLKNANQELTLQNQTYRQAAENAPKERVAQLIEELSRAQDENLELSAKNRVLKISKHELKEKMRLLKAEMAEIELKIRGSDNPTRTTTSTQTVPTAKPSAQLIGELQSLIASLTTMAEEYPNYTFNLRALDPNNDHEKLNQAVASSSKMLSEIDSSSLPALLTTQRPLLDQNLAQFDRIVQEISLVIERLAQLQQSGIATSIDYLYQNLQKLNLKLAPYTIKNFEEVFADLKLKHALLIDNIQLLKASLERRPVVQRLEGTPNQNLYFGAPAQKK